MNTTAVYGNYKPLTIPGPANFTEALQEVKKTAYTVINDVAFLVQNTKGLEKTTKWISANISMGKWLCNNFQIVLSESKVICITAAETTLKSVAETFGAFHIFGSGQKLCRDYSKANAISKISLVFLAVSDSFEALLYLQKQQLVDKITAGSKFIRPVIQFFAFIAQKTGTQRFFAVVFEFAGKVTVNHIKCWTQVIGVSFGLVEIFKILGDIQKQHKHSSCYLKIASDVTKVAMIAFSGSLGFWAGLTATFAFQLLVVVGNTAPVARLIYDNRYPANKV